MKVTCQKCGHTWTPRVAHPQQCTKCKRYDWNWKESDRKETQIDKTSGTKSK